MIFYVNVLLFKKSFMSKVSQLYNHPVFPTVKIVEYSYKHCDMRNHEELNTFEHLIIDCLVFKGARNKYVKFIVENRNNNISITFLKLTLTLMFHNLYTVFLQKLFYV